MTGRRVAAIIGAVALLAACSEGSSDPERPTASRAEATATTEATTTTEAAAWTAIDDRLAALGPEVSLLVAEVADGSCTPLHAVAATTSRPIASQFKLFVLGAVAEEIAAGRLAWDDTVAVEDADKSFGNADGSLQVVPAGTEVTVEDAATTMISISDNTATDVLIELVGRERVEAQAAEWMADATRNVPFLTTKQVFLLHYVPGLAEAYLAAPADERAAFLAAEVDPHPIEDIVPGLTAEPRFVEEIEWFATPTDVCHAFAGLREQADDPALAPLDAVLSAQIAGIGLDRSTWPTVWYKGGSEQGVLTLGWLATDAGGRTVVVEATVTDPDAPLAETAITDLVAVAEDVFALIA